MSAALTLETLEPRPVWAHFATLCAIPRASLHEAALREHLIRWAADQGIASEVDDAGNLILRKPASPGCEHKPGVILQGHLDMVCQANTGTAHDFHRDPIRPELRDGWLVAENTTLGADNGIGVALALAALEDPELVHPALEVLLTVDEETGMDGARELRPGTLRGQSLINLDTEEWGHFYLGCAGGVDVEVQRACATAPIPAGHVTVEVSVTGLRGGHSGIDIHSGRGNAIQLLAGFLQRLQSESDLRLIALAGGTARNAIPREAFATVAVPAGFHDELGRHLAAQMHDWQAHYADSDAGLTLSYIPTPASGGRNRCFMEHSSMPMEPARDATRAVDRLGGAQNASVLAPEDQATLLAFLATAPNGVRQMSADFPGVVDTSDNLGVAALQAGAFRATFKVRSLHDARADALADELVGFAQRHGCTAHKAGAYPGWTPNPASPLLALGQQVYQRQFGQPASLQVIHAGLECGLLAASHPHLDMLSFGPDIQGAHAPGERVEIASVARCWQLLRAVLAQLAA